MKFLRSAAIAAILVPVTAVAAIAAAPNPAFKARHDNFEAMGRAMKGIMDEFRKPAPSVQVIQANAAALAAAAPKVGRQFPKGTGPEAGVKTEALPVIWEKPAEFSAAAKRLAGETANLRNVSRTGDLAAIQQAVGKVGQSCKVCHDTFRKPRS